MAKIELTYMHGEEVYVCNNCGGRINEALIEDYIYEVASRCPCCGEIIEDVELC